MLSVFSHTGGLGKSISTEVYFSCRGPGYTFQDPDPSMCIQDAARKLNSERDVLRRAPQTSFPVDLISYLRDLIGTAHDVGEWVSGENKSRSTLTFPAGSWVHLAGSGPCHVYPGPCKKRKRRPRLTFHEPPFPVRWSVFVPTGLAGKWDPPARLSQEK